MKPRFFKEAVEELLIFLSQTSSKLPPLLDFLFQNSTERENGSSHRYLSMQNANFKLQFAKCPYLPAGR
jgi:hypothetical protein